MTKSKYHAVRTSCGLHQHPSKREAKRCGELQILEKGRAITHLRFQPEYDLCGVKYRADFCYDEIDNDGNMTFVVEDCKGFRTPIYRLKRTLMLNIHGIEIRET